MTNSEASQPFNKLTNTVTRDDATADRTTFYWIVGFMAASFTVAILSTSTELQRFDSAFPLGKVIIFELTGFGIFLALYPVITRLVSQATPGQHDWRLVIPFHLAASVAVAAIHIALFVTARKLLIPMFYGEAYIFTDAPVRDLVYEYRKSLLAYSAFVVAIVFGRILMQQRKELAAAREDAKTSQKLTLKCGGRTIFLNAADVRWVKSAANYVEVAANGKTHFARSTLAGIERQLIDAGIDAARVHRSYVVNKGRIAEINPTGEGDVRIAMEDGEIIPGSRRYRDRLVAPATTATAS